MYTLRLKSTKTNKQIQVPLTPPSIFFLLFLIKPDTSSHTAQPRPFQSLIQAVSQGYIEIPVSEKFVHTFHTAGGGGNIFYMVQILLFVRYYCCITDK